MSYKGGKVAPPPTYIEDGTVRIESIGQNATGVFTNKWEWLEKGGVREVDQDCKISLHAKRAPAARVLLKGVRKQARVLRTWRCNKANLVALVQEMHDLAEEETEKQTCSYSKVFWLGNLLPGLMAALYGTSGASGVARYIKATFNIKRAPRYAVLPLILAALRGEQHEPN